MEKDIKKKLTWTWHAMLYRCYDEKSLSYPKYGGKGIKVCEEWRSSFLAFCQWALENGFDKKMSIDRIDNNKGYFPENCKWSTKKEQQNNRDCCHKILDKNGKAYTVEEVVEITKIDKITIYMRLIRNNKKGKSPLTFEEVSRPIMENKSHKKI